jgi:hypothetical protein
MWRDLLFRVTLVCFPAGLAQTSFFSCLHRLSAQQSSSGSQLITSAGVDYPVYCDQTTDGGGWTLVGTSLGTPLQDQGSSWYNDLTTMQPIGSHGGIWDGMRTHFPSTTSDIRFTCKVVSVWVHLKRPLWVTVVLFMQVSQRAASNDVDLVFYGVSWYRDLTASHFESDVDFVSSVSSVKAFNAVNVTRYVTLGI